MPQKKSKRSKPTLPKKKATLVPGYDAILSDIAGLLESARRGAARTVNTIMTATYWQIGRRIVEYEQRGKHRAAYGAALLHTLSVDLTAHFGRGFSTDNLETMRRFYQVYRLPQISETVSRKFDIAILAKRFPLPWSHYVRLLSIDDPDAASS